MKYTYGFNQYAARDRIINHSLVNEEYLRYSRKEDQEHVIQCSKIFNLRVEFIMELQAKLQRVKHEDVIDDEIENIIYDIRQYLVNRENFSTNQQYIGFKVLFRRYAVKNWSEMDFRYNKIQRI